MIEAAFILPLLILMIASLMLLSLFYCECHYRQVDCHQRLLKQWDEQQKAFSIGKETASIKKESKGLAHVLMQETKTHRIYYLRPAQWVSLGEMITFETE